MPRGADPPVDDLQPLADVLAIGGRELEGFEHRGPVLDLETPRERAIERHLRHLGVHRLQHPIELLAALDEPRELFRAHAPIRRDDAVDVADVSLHVAQVCLAVVGIVERRGESLQILGPALLQDSRGGQVGRAADAIVRLDARAHCAHFTVERGDHPRQLRAAHGAALVADDAARRMRNLVPQRFQRVLFFELLVELLDVLRQGGWIERIEQAWQIRRCDGRAVERRRGVGVAHGRTVEVRAAKSGVQEGAAVLLLELLVRLLERRRLGLGVAEHVRRHLVLERLRILEQVPRAAFVDIGRDVALFGIGLAVRARRMRRPHARRLRELRLEQSMRLARGRRQRRDHAVRRLVQDLAHAREDAHLHREQILHAALPAAFRVRELHRLVPRVVGGVELVQRVDERIAARERHGDEIGLELHLPR
jgi:hypothetical protein